MTDARHALIARYFGNDMTEADSGEFRLIMQTDPEFSDQLARYSLDEYLLAGALSLRAAAEAPASAPAIEANPWSRRHAWLAPLAAAAAVIVAVGVRWMQPRGEGREAREVVAKVAEKVSGVRCQVSEGKWVDLKVGDDIGSGMKIQTEAGGRVKLAWVGEGTTVDLVGSSKLEIRNSKLARLKAGRLAASVAKQEVGRPFVVETPYARATVQGTRFSLLVSDQSTAPADSALSTRHSVLRSTRLDVTEGSVLLSDRSGHSVEVGVDEYAVAEAGRAVAAFPGAIDYEAAVGARRQYGDGLIVFQDNFDGPAQGWLPLVAEGPGAGEQKDRLNIVKSGPAVPPEQVGVTEMKAAGKPTKMLRLQSPAADDRQYGAWGQYNPKMRSYSVNLMAQREPGAFAGTASRTLISGIRLPAGALTQVIAGSDNPDLPIGKPTAVRMEYLMELVDASNAVVDAKVFHDGHLRGWTQTRGRADEFGGELLVSAVNGSLLVDDVVVTRLVPGRGTNDLLALYRFDEGQGTMLHDVSGAGEPLDLTIAKPDQVKWLKQGMAINGPAQITSAMSPEITDAWRKSGSLTIEWWDKPRLGDKTQEQLYAIMDLVSRTHVFTHHQIFYDIPADAKAFSTHYVLTLTARDRAVAARSYCNGRFHSDVAGADENTLQTFSGNGVRLQIPGGSSASRRDSIRPWTGECHLLAIYGRALSPAEIWRNYQAGLPEKKAE